MTQLDYTFDRQIELEREDARQEGWEAGRKDGQAEGEKRGQETAEILNIKKLMENLNMTMDQAMDALDIADDRREKYRSMIRAGGL